MQSKNSPLPDIAASSLPMHQSRRCFAKTRTGQPCCAPAMPNGRCRMHGGKSTGAPTGNKNARKHGMYGHRAIEERKHLRTLIQDVRALVEEVTDDE